MTLKTRLDGVYRQYGARRPDVAFMTAEVMHSALYSRGRGGSAYFGGEGRSRSSLPDDVAGITDQELGSVSFEDAVAFYFRELLGKGILAFLDQLQGVVVSGMEHDLEHCLRREGRWVGNRPRPNRRRTSRRRTSYRVA